MRRLILGLLLALAACGATGSDTAADTTTSTTATSTTASTTTVTTTTTTTQPVGPTEITRLTVFEPGTPYRGTFEGIVEYQIRFQQEGWRVAELGLNLRRSIRFENHRPSLEPGAHISMFAWMQDLTPSEVAEWYRTDEGVEESTEPQAVKLGGHSALQFDLLASRLVLSSRDPCGLDFPPIPTVDDGFSPVDGDAYLEGIFACTWTRIWVVDLDGRSLTVAASAGLHELVPEQVWEISEFEPLLDDFINAITFCTEATPCDD